MTDWRSMYIWYHTRKHPPQKIWRTHSSKSSYHNMERQMKSFRIEGHYSPRNFGNHWRISSESNTSYPHHSTHRLTDRQKGPIRQLNSTWDAISITNKMIGSNYCHWHNLPSTTTHQSREYRHFMPTTGNIRTYLGIHEGSNQLRKKQTSLSNTSKNYTNYCNKI